MKAVRRFTGLRLFGFGLFLVPWLVVLLVPQLRLMLWVQMAGSSLHWHQLPWTHTVEDDCFSPIKIAARHHEDVPALAAAAESMPGHEAIRLYDKALQRSPNQSRLIAARLHHTLRYFRDDREAGDMENPHQPPYAAPSPERSEAPPNFTPAQLEEAIALARRGRRLEADNVYYDLALAYFLMAAYRDDETLRVIAEGSKKQYFRDHRQAVAEAHLQVLQRVRPLLLEEKLLQAWDYYWDWGPQRHRHLARMVAWRAVKRERSGDRATALGMRIWLARLGLQLMRAGEGAGYTVQAIAWSVDVRTIGWQQRARKYASYVRATGRPRLAAEILALSAAGTRFQEKRKERSGMMHGQGLNAYNSKMVQAEQALNRSEALWWIAIALLVQLGVLSVLWCSLSLALLGDAGEDVPQPSLRAILLLYAFLTIGGAFAIYGYCHTTGPTYLRAWEHLEWPMAAAHGAFVWAALMPIAAAYAMTWRHMRLYAREHLSDPQSHWVARFFPYPTWFHRVAGDWGLLFITMVCLGSAAAGWQKPDSPLAIPFFSSTRNAWLLIHDPASVFGPPAVVLVVLCYSLWLLKWRWLMAPGLLPHTRSGLRLARHALGVAVLLSSHMYLCVSAASVNPVRHEQKTLSAALEAGELLVVRRMGIDRALSRDRKFGGWRFEKDR